MKTMKKTMSLFLLLAVLISSLTGCFRIPANYQETSTTTSQEVTTYETYEKIYSNATLEDDFFPDGVIVLLQPPYNTKEYTVDDFPEIDCTEVREIYHVEEGVLGRILFITLAEQTKQNVLDAIYKLELRDDVYCTDPNMKMEYEVTPDDEKYNSNEQWAINKLSLPAAWDITTGSSSIYVGVIDSGIDITHPDLADQVNTNLSRCFSPDFDTPFEDTDGHGTAVAGVIGAQADNTIGITGVCWNVQLVSLRNATTTNTPSITAAIEAVNYAATAGIQILNYSAGGYVYTDLYDTFRTSIDNYPGLFVCSAGNEGQDNDDIPHYPSDFELSNMIVVGASSGGDRRWTDSNYGGTKVDIFAPGSYILSTDLSGTYTKSSGTSLAAPHVSGVAALLLSKYPSLSPECIKYIIMNNVDIVYNAGGYSVFEGWCVSGGRLNAYKAVSATHGHTYQNENSFTQHKATCSCGYVTYEPHTWTTVSVRPSANVSINALVQYECTKCGYISMVRPSDY